MKLIDHINVHVFRATASDPKSAWLMDIKVDGVTAQHERCCRDYASASDAITSARHAARDLEKRAGENCLKNP